MLHASQSPTASSAGRCWSVCLSPQHAQRAAHSTAVCWYTLPVRATVNRYVRATVNRYEGAAARTTHSPPATVCTPTCHISPPLDVARAVKFPVRPRATRSVGVLSGSGARHTPHRLIACTACIRASRHRCEASGQRQRPESRCVGGDGTWLLHGAHQFLRCWPRTWGIEEAGPTCVRLPSHAHTHPHPHTHSHTHTLVGVNA